ncbi:hypothetical protein BDW66DRAFT_125417 [Aspergillus desertorum]
MCISIYSSFRSVRMTMCCDTLSQTPIYHQVRPAIWRKARSFCSWPTCYCWLTSQTASKVCMLGWM